MLSMSNAEMLIHAFMTSRVDYCNALLGGCAARLINKLQMVQNQWWSVTKYNYFVTVLKYIFQVSVLYWSSFILSNFYFYFTTFQSIRSYFLLHYIS